MSRALSHYEIRKGIINQSAVIGVRPPLSHKQLELISPALRQITDGRITYGDIATGYTEAEKIYTEIHINSDSNADTYIDDAVLAIGTSLVEQGATLAEIPETDRFVGRIRPFFVN